MVYLRLEPYYGFGLTTNHSPGVTLVPDCSDYTALTSSTIILYESNYLLLDCEPGTDSHIRHEIYVYKKSRLVAGIFVHVPRAGFEPAIYSLRRNRPRPLDERGNI